MMMILCHEVETSRQLKLYFLQCYVYLCQASVSFAYRFATSLSSLYNFRSTYIGTHVCTCAAGEFIIPHNHGKNEIQNARIRIGPKNLFHEPRDIEPILLCAHDAEETGAAFPN